jgi:hypothetical protein
MYIVKNSSNEIVAICTRHEDARSFQNSGNIDNESYTIEDDLEMAAIEEQFLQIQDGCGEGQLV